MPIIPKPADLCGGCPLYAIDSRGFSIPEGRGTIGVMIVGEALGATERYDGLPFRPQAESGSILERAIKRLGHDRQQFVLWNTVACQPPSNMLSGTSYEHQAIEHCKVHFDAVVKRFQPRVILALGAIPFRALTGLSGHDKQALSLCRGYVLHSKRYNIPVVASFHPSFINRGNKKYAGVLMRDISLAIEVARNGIPEQIEPDYIEHPTVTEAWEYYEFLKANPHLPISYDIETPKSSSEANESHVTYDNTRPEQIQFTHKSHYGWAFPWGGEFIDVAHAILRLPNDKWGWNSWHFDNPILRKQGCVLNGKLEDLMLAWHSLQPDFFGDAQIGLLGLQSAASFYAPYAQPWKHLSSWNLANYGCRDVDMTYRIGEKIFDDLKKRKVLRSYEEHKRKLWPIMDRMSERGFPVDREKHQALKLKIEIEMEEIDKEIQLLVPDDVRERQPKAGYKVLPKVWREAIRVWGESWNDGSLDERCNDYATAEEYAAMVTGFRQMQFGDEVKWCQLHPFNAGSPKQMIAYLKYRGIPVPKSKKTGNDTTAELELNKIYKRTKDPVVGQVRKQRKLSKMIDAFIDSWYIHEDGRLHPVFYLHRTGSGQTSCRSPNVQQIPKHGKLAEELRKCIVPRVGHTLVEADFHSFHAQTLARLSNDAPYMRLARQDVHSYVTAHFLRGEPKLNITQLAAFSTPEEIEIMRESEPELRERLLTLDKWLSYSDVELGLQLHWIAKHFKPIRNYKSKRAILGIGFGMGAQKLYDMNEDSFASLKEAKALGQLLQSLFPRLFQWQNEIRRQAHNEMCLTSAHGYLRNFYEVFRWDTRKGGWTLGEQSEEAIAFLPANDAHGHAKDAILRCEAAGYLEKYNFINFIHDALVFECSDELVDECVRNVKAEMERKSTILTGPLCPDGFSCEVDAMIGKSWGAMNDYKAIS